jgi:hypothetical protein
LLRWPNRYEKTKTIDDVVVHDLISLSVQNAAVRQLKADLESAQAAHNDAQKLAVMLQTRLRDAAAAGGSKVASMSEAVLV